MTAASPGIVASAMENRFYPSREEYVRAVAAALASEYRFIVDQGLLLQIDAPDLAMERHTLFADSPLSEFLDWVALVIDATNDALAGIDPSRVRLHVCWGNYEGPHTRDVALDDILALLYEARVGALVLSMANATSCPRARVLHPTTTARRHGARRGRHRHHEQLRRARGGRRGAHRAHRDRPWVTLTACSPRPTAGSTPPRGSATSRPRSCGRSCEPCARAPIARASACSDRQTVTPYHGSFARSASKISRSSASAIAIARTTCELALWRRRRRPSRRARGQVPRGRTRGRSRQGRGPRLRRPPASHGGAPARRGRRTRRRGCTGSRPAPGSPPSPTFPQWYFAAWAMSIIVWVSAVGAILPLEQVVGAVVALDAE